MKFIRIFNVLIALVLAEWALVIVISYNFSFSKLSYKFPSYEGLLARMSWHHMMAEESRANMTKWLSANSDLKRFMFDPERDVRSEKTAKKFLCVGILTMERQRALFYYLNTIVMALLTRIPLKHHKNVSIILLNTDSNYGRTELRQLSELLFVDNITSRVYHPYEKTKEAADYALAMKYLHKQNCMYSLILEDDALASYDWFQKVYDAITHIAENYDKDGWMCIKLYTGFQYSDWLLHTPTVVQVIFYSFLFAILNLFLGETLRKTMTKNLTSYTRRSTLPTAFLFLFVCSSSIVCWLTSISTHPLGTGVKKYSQGRNTVGVIFNPNNVIQLADYLLDVVDELVHGRSEYIRPKDILMNNFKASHRLVEFIVEPSVFQHIGMHSSLSVRDYKSLEILKGIFKSYSYPDDDRPILFSPEYWQKP